jgi:hypothetical protein
MNERIYQAAKQAGLLPRHLGPVVETRHMAKKKQDLEKFAELIVRECADFLKDTLDDHFAAEQLEEHFGVEDTKREQFDRAIKAAFKDGADLSGKETP